MPLLRDFISQVELPGYNFQLLVIITYIVQQRDDDLSLYYCSVSRACPTKTLVERIVYVSTFRESIWNVN